MEALNHPALVRRWNLVAGFLTLALLSVGALLVWLAVSNADTRMRTALLWQASLVGRTVDARAVQGFNGAAADLASPDYVRIENALGALKSTDPRYRALFLLGRDHNVKSDHNEPAARTGGLFYLVDSEPTGRVGHFEPGTRFGEPPEKLQAIFMNRSPLVVGPYHSEGETRVTAFVPVTDRRTVVADHATPEQARDMVARALSYYRAKGRQALLKALNDPAGEFANGDLYAFAYDTSMNVLAHPWKPELVGQNLLDRKDWPGGKLFRREMRDLALSKGSGWVDYEYENPANHELEPKTTYVERADDLIIGAGAYKGTGAAVAILGIDADVGDWNYNLALAAVPATLLTLTLIVLLWISTPLLGRQRTGNGPRYLRHLAPLSVAAAGLALTLFAVNYAREDESGKLEDSFRELFKGNTDTIAEALRGISDFELEGLAIYLHSKPDVDSEDFAHYASHLTNSPLVQAWAWAPAVGDAGRRLGSATAFPVHRVAPEQGNEKLLGFDLGSEPLRRKAMEEAAATGLTTATAPLKLVHNNLSQSGILIFRPLLDGDERERLRGFCVAQVGFGTLLNSAGPTPTTPLELSLLGDGIAPVALAASGQTKGVPRAFKVTRPFYAVGRVFAVTAYGDEAFRKANTRRLDLLTGITGVLLTGALVLLVSLMTRRREELERLVVERTRRLKESEERHRAMFEKNRSVQLLIDPDTGNIVNANSAAADFYGFDLERLRSMSILELNVLPPEAVRSELAATLADSRHTFHFRHRLADSSVRDVEVHSAPIPQDDRILIYSIIHDITDRKRMEDFLRKSEQNYRSQSQRLNEVIWATNIGTWEWNAQTGETAFSKRWAEVLGYSLTELSPVSVDTWRRRMHPDDLALSDELIKKHLRREAESYEVEVRMAHRDGSWVWVGLRGRVVEWTSDGRPLRMSGTHQDITPRKQFEQAIRDGREMLNLILNSTAEAIYGTDLSGTCTFCNRACLELLGFDSDEELLGRNVHQLIHHTRVDSRSCSEADCSISNSIRLGRVAHGDDEIFWRKDGTSFPVEYWSHPQHKEGVAVGAVVTFIDITDRREAERSLRETNLHLEETTARANQLAAEAAYANDAKSDFLANMSHEIRTPMNGVIGMIGLLLDTDLSDEQRRYAKLVRESGESLLIIINDILDFSKIEAGRMALEVIDFELDTLLDDFSAALALRARDKGLQFKCYAEKGVPAKLSGDPGRLRQVLTNLTGNAIKFTASGEVAVVVSLVEQVEESVTLCFTIRDTGIGIAPEKLELLFHKFTQADASTTRKYGGTGLGLAISKQLVELLGGEIGVESTLGEGSVFHFTARFGNKAGITASEDSNPFAAQPHWSEKQSPAHRPKPELNGLFNGSKARLLLAEDNPTNQLVALGLLRKLGFTVDAVADGAQALKALEFVPYDLVLMDVQMPELDGFEATRRIRHPNSRVLNPSVPIIAMTARARAEDRKACLAAGMDDYLPKPIDPGEVARVLGKWLPKEVSTFIAPHVKSEAILISTVDGSVQPVWDRNGMEERMMGDQGLVEIICEAFLLDLPTQIGKLKSFLENSDAVGSERQAHTIKGASANVGGERLKGVALEMEKLSKAGNLAAVVELLPQLEKEFGELREVIANRKN